MSFIYQRTVRFQDTDAAGVVYFANVLSICHEAYEASLATSGINLKAFFTHPSVAFPVVHASVDFFRPMYCGDILLISLVPQKTSRDKFTVTYKITGGEVVFAQAMTRQVCLDVSSRTKRELPEIMINWLEVNQ
jgi:1,4-dihydroxy-2-naphthoyl-CoA hydrolase